MLVKFDPHSFEPWFQKFIWSVSTLIIILLAGSFGYWWLGGEETTWFDGLYMTIITVSTIGYGETIDLTNNIPGRIFTIGIAFAGVGVLAYVTSQITAEIVGGKFLESYRRKKMIKAIEQMQGHCIVCGVGSVGIHIVKQLRTQDYHCVIVEKDETRIHTALEQCPEQLFVLGDATEDHILTEAGIQRAKGLFAATENDNHNLVISFSARQLNPNLKIIANCRQAKNEQKLQKAGADAVISPAFMGAFRMANEMIRPNVVTLIESILQRKLLLEEIPIPQALFNQPLSSLNLVQYPQTILIALKRQNEWLYNPPKTHIIQPSDLVVIMTTEDEKDALKNDLDSLT